MNGASLDPIATRLHDITPYHPMNAEVFADWSLEAGDMVSVSRNGTSYTAPVHTTTLKWDGRQTIATINSEGNKERDAISKLSAQKYTAGRGGSGGYNNNKELHWEMTSEDGLLHSAINATASELKTEYNTIDSRLYTTIMQTATHFAIELGNTESGLYGHISATAGGLETSFSAANSSLYTVISQTASHFSVELANTESGLYGHISATAGGLETSFSNANSAVYSYVRQTASNIRTEVANTASGLYSYIDVTAGSIEIGSDRIVLGATTSGSASSGPKLSAVLSISDGAAYFTRQVMVSSGGGVVSINGGKVSATTLQGGTLTLSQTQSDSPTNVTETLTVSQLRNLKTSASVSGNSLTITNADGTTTTFSKATTLSGVWSGNTYKVTATPQNETKSTTLLSLSGTGSVTKTGMLVSQTMNIMIEDPEGGQTPVASGAQLTAVLDATKVYYAGSASVSLGAGTWEHALSYEANDAYESNQLSISTSGITTSAGVANDTTRQWRIYATSDDNTSYARLASSAGQIIAKTVHNKHKTGYNSGVDSVWFYYVNAVGGDWSDQGELTGGSMIALGYNAYGTTARTYKKAYWRVPSTAVTVNGWSRSNFDSDTQARTSTTLDIPVSVNVNGTAYTHTFTTSTIRLERYASTYYANVKCGSVTIARLYIDGFSD